MKALLSLSVLLFAAAAFAGPQEAGKPAEACEKQHAQCMKQCDKEKRAWFFKGEAYDNCAAKCEARTASCAATGMGDGTGDGTGDKTGRHRDHGRADAGGDASDSADQPQAEEIPESGEGDPDEASGKGKDRAGDRGRKDKDRDAAEDESGTEDDE